MTNLKKFEAWFITGSQHLYGEVALQQVASHSQRIAGGLADSDRIPLRVVFKPIATTPAPTTDERTRVYRGPEDRARVKHP